MDPVPRSEIRPGEPLSASDAEFLERFDARIRLPIIVSAILPLVVAPEAGNWIGIVVGVGSWLVFLVDYVVQARHREHFRRTGYGRFDLVVVVVTAPWFLLPGAHPGGFVVLLRLARLVRLVIASRGAHRLLQRLGRVAALAGGVVVVSSLVAYHAEHATNSGFATVGDALWWGIVTLTTVGYGDIVPKTPTGRWAGVVIMVTGIAVLGLLSGSLASFFRVQPGEDAASRAPDEGESDRAPTDGTVETSTVELLRTLVSEVEALRQQVSLLGSRTADEGDTTQTEGT